MEGKISNNNNNNNFNILIFNDRNWTLDDICHKSIGLSDGQSLGQTNKAWADAVSPCHVITPIDCFSDGLELLVYRKDYLIYDRKRDKPEPFNWSKEAQKKSRKQSIAEVAEPRKVLEKGCPSVTGYEWNRKEIMSDDTLQSAIRLMSADTLFTFWNDNPDLHKSFLTAKSRSGDRQRIVWSEHKAAEILEQWLNQLIENIEQEPDTFFFSPNFVQLHNLKLGEVLAQNGATMAVNTAVALIAICVFQFRSKLVTFAVFAAMNILLYGAYSVAWASIITYQALEVNEVKMYCL